MRQLELYPDSQGVGGVLHGADQLVVVGQQVIVEPLGVGVPCVQHGLTVRQTQGGYHYVDQAHVPRAPGYTWHGDTCDSVTAWPSAPISVHHGPGHVPPLHRDTRRLSPWVVTWLGGVAEGVSGWAEEAWSPPHHFLSLVS